jgi:hypothetical protein
MEHVEITAGPGGFEVRGVPDAALVVALDHPAAMRLSDLALHKRDLDFAAQCLDNLNALPAEFALAKESLWESAIVHFVKCFGSSKARGQLSRERIYKQWPEALVAFDYFKDLRDKHIVHDENPFSTSLPIAVLNDGTKPHMVEKIATVSLIGMTLGEADWRNLVMSVRVAREAVESEYDEICEKITSDLEGRSYEQLVAMGPAMYTAPGAEQVGRNRRGPQNKPRRR